MGNESIVHNANILPARRGNGAAITVDTTARAHAVTTSSWNAQTYKENYDESLFLDLQNDGTNPIYFYFSPTNTVDLNEATIQPATDANLVNANAVPKVLRAGQDTPIEIDRDLDKFIIVKSTGGNTTLRVFPSSKSTLQPA